MNNNKDSRSFPPPYPPPSAAERDERFAQKVMRAYSGESGELGAVAAYSYWGILAGTFRASLADLFEMISISEMKHFKLLGELIVALGGNPVLQCRVSAKPFKLTATNNDAVADTMLALSLTGERRAAEQYRELIGSTKDAAATALLRRILSDEEEHIRLLEKALCR